MTRTQEGTWLWTPEPAAAGRTQLAAFQRWVEATHGETLPDYDALWRWSVRDTAVFWGAIWRYFEVQSAAGYRAVRHGDTMQNTQWFAGAKLNYAEHVLRPEAAHPQADALICVSEDNVRKSLSWSALGTMVRRLADALRGLGVQPEDRVAAILPNGPEAVVAFLATASIGAVWSAASVDFGSATIVDRFAQIEPKVLFATGAYRYGGRRYDRREALDAVIAALPGLQHLVWIDDGVAPAPARGVTITTWDELLQTSPEEPRERFRFEHVPADHPLWILYSSGTTGLPKAIVHGHAGMLVEHLKVMHLHFDLRSGSVLFFHTTTGWMMWNIVVASLLTGATAVLYDGSPAFPDVSRLWSIAAQCGATHFGASPSYVHLMEKAALCPREQFDLRRLAMVTVSGSPCAPETFAWVYREVSDHVQVASQSGGTEICSAFVGSVPTLPVYAGEIQGRMLGMDVEAWDPDGHPVLDEVGELVVRQAFPSMPLRFWNDDGDVRYRSAYFATFPGVWRHGDYLKINRRGGCFIYGRSDSTLNRHGVRIGTAEIYRIVDQVPGITDSLVVCLEYGAGRFFMPLFVTLGPGVDLDDDLRRSINDRLRRDGSPRHVPDRIEAVASIPYTLTGKKMEVPVRRILEGESPRSAANVDAMRNPAAMDFFIAFAGRWRT